MLFQKLEAIEKWKVNQTIKDRRESCEILLPRRLIDTRVSSFGFFDTGTGIVSRFSPGSKNIQLRGCWMKDGAKRSTMRMQRIARESSMIS